MTRSTPGCSHRLGSAEPKAELAPDQLAAVAHPGGPARIIAPAGSGKTRVLTERIRHLLVDRGHEPQLVTAVAYNVMAADQLRERTAGFRPTIRTLNSLGLNVCSRRGDWRIADEPFCREVLSGLVKTARKVGTDPLAPYLDALATIRLGLVPPEKAEDFHPDAAGIAAAFPAYRDALHGAGRLDFDEQIYKAIELLLADPDLRAEVRAEARTLLVDEFQDLTPAHLLLIRLVAGPAADVFGVGDDDQVIYGYAGADPGFLIDYRRYFPGAATYDLQVNYRCPPAVVDAARTLLGHNHRRIDKTIRAAVAPSEPDEGRNAQGPMALDTVRGRRQAPADDGLVVRSMTERRHGAGHGRAGAAMGRGRRRLLRHRRAHPGELFAAAGAAAARRGGDPVPGGGRAVDPGAGRARRPPWPTCGSPPTRPGSPGPTCGPRCGARPARSPRRPSTCWPATPSRRCVRSGAWPNGWRTRTSSSRTPTASTPTPPTSRPWPRPWPSPARPPPTCCASSATRSASARRWRPSTPARAPSTAPATATTSPPCCRWLPPPRRRHLRGLAPPEALLPPGRPTARTATVPRDPGVHLATVHRVKGREWPRVVVFGADAGLFPHRLSIDVEEERRIFHVGITRAKDQAVVLADAAGPSPFVEELHRPAPPRPGRSTPTTRTLPPHRRCRLPAAPTRRRRARPRPPASDEPGFPATPGAEITLAGGLQATIEEIRRGEALVETDTGVDGRQLRQRHPGQRRKRPPRRSSRAGGRRPSPPSKPGARRWPRRKASLPTCTCPTPTSPTSPNATPTPSTAWPAARASARASSTSYGETLLGLLEGL